MKKNTVAVIFEVLEQSNKFFNFLELKFPKVYKKKELENNGLNFSKCEKKMNNDINNPFDFFKLGERLGPRERTSGLNFLKLEKRMGPKEQKTNGLDFLGVSKRLGVKEIKSNEYNFSGVEDKNDTDLRSCELNFNNVSTPVNNILYDLKWLKENIIYFNNMAITNEEDNKKVDKSKIKSLEKKF